MGLRKSCLRKTFTIKTKPKKNIKNYKDEFKNLNNKHREEEQEYKIDQIENEGKKSNSLYLKKRS